MLLATLLSATKKSTPRGGRSSNRFGTAGSVAGAGEAKNSASALKPQHVSKPDSGSAPDADSEPAPEPFARPVFKVVHVIDGNTLEVRPHWVWNGHSGGKVQIANHHPPALNAPGGPEARGELAHLIRGNSIELGATEGIHHGRLVCEVYMNDTPLPSLLKNA